jgi:hypothetical protein
MKSVKAVRRGARATKAKPAEPRAKKPTRVTFPMPKRLVVIGDLNGDDSALEELLGALSIIDKKGTFIASGTHVVQLGDVVNRGASPRRALHRLMTLEKDAPRRGGRVTMLLGNHEAMVALGNLAWCYPEEILEFATFEEREEFERARGRMIYRLLEENTRAGRTAPIIGVLRAWEEANVPGREAYVRGFGADGHVGRYIRSLPVAIRVGRALLVHGGLLPRFAKEGLLRLDRIVQDMWARRPTTALELQSTDAIIAEDGPLWCRSLVTMSPPVARAVLDETLRMVRASTMIVGHTRTDLIGGERGRPFPLLDNRLICADTGIGQESVPACVVIEKDVMWSFRPDQKKERIGALPPLLEE